MIFVCGTLDWNNPLNVAAQLTRMAAGRRAAAARSIARVEGSGGGLGHAESSMMQAHVGSCSAFLLRAGGAYRSDDAGRLEALARSYADGLAPAIDTLGGVFFLLLVDTATRRASLANDRFGICPVFYTVDGTTLRFASCLDALKSGAVTPQRIDRQAVYDYVFFHCIPSPRTIYQDVAKLGPAEELHWHGARCEARSYWQPVFASSDDGIASLGGALRAALGAAVSERAVGACGAFLSGGLDSSSVAGLLQQSTTAARTFTIGFDAAGYDESAFARLAAQHFGTEHHEYFVTPSDVTESLPQIAAHYGEPFGNSSVIPTYHCARFAREHGVETMLAGDGGDELFAGNTRYLEQRKFDFYLGLPGLVRSPLEAAYRWLPWLARLPVAGKGARYIQQAKMGLPDRLQSYNFLNRFEPATVFSPEWLADVDSEAPWQLWRARYGQVESGDALQRMLYLDWKFTLADNDLVKVSNMCDLAGVDVSYPMLDERVVDLSARVSPASLLAGGQLRGFYKNAFADFLPAAIINKSKHGFGLPFGVWMREDSGLQELAATALKRLRQRDIFLPQFIDQAERLYREEAASGYYGELVWILTMLELWLGAHGV